MLEPKIALVTTTINVPNELRVYREFGADVTFFVAGDEKTPHAKCDALLDDLGNHGNYYSPQDQRKLGYKCSDLIGFGTIGRRNIALLEALKWGADIIVFWDDDNLAYDSSYFDHFVSVLHHSFTGICAQSFADWFDVGQLLQPISPHRGFPIETSTLWQAKGVVNAKVGVAAGICLGDPDISAITRIANHPDVHGVSELLRSGIVVHPRTKTVFNSQNTAFIRELAPAMLMVPQFKRYDDIFASLICQRVMRARGMHVHFGHPFVYQQRNQHNLAADLQNEMLGVEHVTEFADWLDCVEIDPDFKMIPTVRRLYDLMSKILPWMPAGVSELGHAWCDDIESVMG